MSAAVIQVWVTCLFNSESSFKPELWSPGCGGCSGAATGRQPHGPPCRHLETMPCVKCSSCMKLGTYSPKHRLAWKGEWSWTRLPLSQCNISPQSLVQVLPAMVKSSQCPGQLKSRLRSSGSLMFYYCFCRSLMGNTLVWTSSIMFTQSYATRLFGRAVLCIFIISIYLCVRWRMSTRVQASAQAHTYMHAYPFSLLLISSWCGFGWERFACFWTKYFFEECFKHIYKC